MATTRMQDVKVPEDAEWLTIKEAAKHARCSYARLTRAVKEGHLPHGKVPYSTSNRGVRIRKRDVERWLEEGATA